MGACVRACMHCMIMHFSPFPHEWGYCGQLHVHSGPLDRNEQLTPGTLCGTPRVIEERPIVPWHAAFAQAHVRAGFASTPCSLAAKVETPGSMKRS